MTKKTEIKNTCPALVINLDRSITRWNKISKDLDQVKIAYKRFPAIDGMNVNITNAYSGESFLGLDLQFNPSLLKADTLYEIRCDKNNHEQIDFKYFVKNDYLVYGELGQFCSLKRIIKNFSETDCPSQLILEDDANIATKGFAFNLTSVRARMPKDTSILYLMTNLMNGKIIPVSGNKYVNQFSQDARYYCNHALIITKRGAEIFNSIEVFNTTSDNSLLNLAKGKEFKAYVSAHNFSSERIISAKFDYQNSEISKTGCRTSFGKSIACNDYQINNNIKNFTIDKALIINLPESLQRRERILENCKNIPLNCEIFTAVHGYNTLIEDPSGFKFTGLDLKQKKVLIQNEATYKVTCYNGVQDPVIINITSIAKTPLIAGTIGIWCSSILIRKYIVDNKLNNTLFFEDDFVMDSVNFNRNLNLVGGDLPEDYDMLYLHPHFFKKNDNNVVPIDGKKYIEGFNLQSEWWGTWAVLMSYNGALKSGTSERFFGAQDQYFTQLAKGQINSTDVKFYAYKSKLNFSPYPTSYFSGHSKDSIITTMGCRKWHKSSKEDCDFSNIELHNTSEITAAGESILSNLNSIFETLN